ncbi:hypothetical protein [Amycolatopsis sp. DG1A-15b]|uniref:hypothetical protein n=1 Tax=Amycolatopsis sp. DG1A-15b TaxID=3052846 RepID=UPI00255B8CF0|nr:hypothetical protein [Amycolatopsis sp. DG1A-15b]WIX87779.1 hypothetical protein QRY02_42690 [Amycolatopsis sp. DG1A-15b]
MIRAKTERCFCLWRVRIEYSYRGDKHTLVVPPPSRPPHRVEYTMRIDCLAQPASCRFKPTF